MTSLRILTATTAFLLSACTGSVTFRSTLHQSVDLDMYASTFTSAGLASGGPGGNTVANVPCAPQGPSGDALCQAIVPASGAGSDIVLRCNATGHCDPEPYRVVADLGVQDLHEVTSAKVSVIDHFELIGIDAVAETNTANIDIPAFELRWGSESASTGNLATSTQLLAHVPAIASGSTGNIDVSIEDAGLAALDAYLRDTSSRVRFFLVTNLDLQPGQALPAGHIDLTVGLIIRASGRLR